MSAAESSSRTSSVNRKSNSRGAREIWPSSAGATAFNASFNICLRFIQLFRNWDLSNGADTGGLDLTGAMADPELPAAMYLSNCVCADDGGATRVLGGPTSLARSALARLA